MSLPISRAARWVSLALTATVLSTVHAATSTTAAASPSAGTPGAPTTGSAKAALDRGHRPDRAVQPTLEARATLSADFLASGPPSGALASPANGRTGPFPGQVIPGFSAMIENGDGTFWAQPDNGFGTKANSADFLLRLYKIRPDWETADGGPGEIRVERFISLRDPARKVTFPITNQATTDRLLTGADFDIESVVRGRDGSFWIGEEFGPFLLHVSADGRVLEAPVPLPDGKSPQNPFLAAGEQPRVPASRGFEAMGGSANGRYLYPILEGAFVDDADQRRRVVYEFDTRRSAYTGRTWRYQVDEAPNVIGDAFTVRRDKLVLIERDNLDGPAAVTKRLYEIDLGSSDSDGFVEKRLVVDLLKIANPARIGVASSPGAYGVSDPFSFPFVSVEVVVELRDGRLLVGNDNNYPGDDARVPGTPDDTELVVVDLPRLRPSAPGDTLVIGHRGSSGTRPEHTLAAYEQAILACADYIEPDLVSTRDGVLVARHENEIGGTTDVASRPEFAGRRTTRTIDGVALTGWFTEDFTLAELKTLRAVERIPGVRPQNTPFNGLYAVPTLDEVLDLARRSRTCGGEAVGVYPETKHPTYFDGIGLSLEEPLLATLAANGYDGDDPVYLQSFETTNLRELDGVTDFRITQLTGCTGAPYDLAVAGDPRTYADIVSRQGLRDVAQYADGLGACKDQLIPRDASGRLLRPTAVIDDAHREGLQVHPYTFRVENQFLPLQFRRGTDPAAPGDLEGELNAFLRAGIDGFFTDNPAIGARVVR
ncbi:glycerophosphodiester phosphodiesterase [Nocardioides sp. zg-1308]|uniref:esterase-like activity of phytase family protein n=1 Tax=Nocardioides sp. zg-1308 TaxID=2736253 RepID=UPI0015524CBD|nr:esterase-like activity of phytase family protein [Nocardioides sp. zg-1308]NPD03185.1 glycerophosphodiester phosphodiesterase [Nocardioides sp. zg-1308]